MRGPARAAWRPLLCGLLALAAPGAAAAPKICVDPGHGGSDPGAVGVGGVEEAGINLDIALRFKELLEADTADASCGGEWDVVLTRDTDRDVSLAARSSYANAQNADRFMSIHNNAFNGAAHGTETFSYSEGGSGADLRCKIQPELIAHIGTYDRGCKTANFHVLRETSMPATLTECAFVDHPGDCAILTDPGKRQEMARAHLHALQAHYGIAACDPGSAQPQPLMEIAVQADAPGGGDPDFCAVGGSESVFDLVAGQRTTYRVMIVNNGGGAARGVRVGVTVAAPWLVVRRYDIYDDAHSSTCGETWCLNDSNDNPENPPHDAPGESFALGLYSFGPGETKMVQMEVEAAEAGPGDGAHAQVKAWVKHVDDVYDKESFDSPFTDRCSCQTFNGGDLRAAFATDVFGEEVCDGADNDCDGETDEDGVCRDTGEREAGAEARPDAGGGDEGEEGATVYAEGWLGSACGCGLVR